MVISPSLLIGKGAEVGTALAQVHTRAGQGQGVCLWAPVLQIRTNVSSVQGHSPSSGQGPPVLSATPSAPSTHVGCHALSLGAACPPTVLLHRDG